MFDLLWGVLFRKMKNFASTKTEHSNPMTLTDYQAKYFAHELTRSFPSDSVEKVTVAFAGAQVDLNPHQIDADLFAFNSPLSRGALLADGVGLGKPSRQTRR